MRRIGYRPAFVLIILMLAMLPALGAKGGSKGAPGGGDTPSQIDYSQEFFFASGLNVITKEAADPKPLRVLNSDSGFDQRSSWVQEGFCGSRVVLADLDGEGNPEVVIASCCKDETGVDPVYWFYVNVLKEGYGGRAYDADKNPYGVYATSFFDELIVTDTTGWMPELLVGEFDGDPQDEIVLVTRSKAAILDLQPGAGFSKLSEIVFDPDGTTDNNQWHHGFSKASGAGDLDGDGLDELIVGVNEWYSTDPRKPEATSAIKTRLVMLNPEVSEAGLSFPVLTTEVFGEEGDSDIRSSNYGGGVHIGRIGGVPTVFASVTDNWQDSNNAVAYLMAWQLSTEAANEPLKMVGKWQPFADDSALDWAIGDLYPDETDTSELVMAGTVTLSRTRVKGKWVTEETGFLQVGVFDPVTVDPDIVNSGLTLSQEVTDTTAGGSPQLILADTDGDSSLEIVLSNWGENLIEIWGIDNNYGLPTGPELSIPRLTDNQYLSHGGVAVLWLPEESTP